MIRQVKSLCSFTHKVENYIDQYMEEAVHQMLDGIRTTKLTEKERDASVALLYTYLALREDDLATGMYITQLTLGVVNQYMFDNMVEDCPFIRSRLCL